MECQTLMIRAPPKFSAMFSHRGVFHYAAPFYFLMVLFYTLLILATCERCLMDGMQNQEEYDACRSYGAMPGTDIQNIFDGDIISGHELQNAVPPQSRQFVCPNSNLFCFGSTLPGFSSQVQNVKSKISDLSDIQSDFAMHVHKSQGNGNISSLSDCGNFKLSGGRTVSCSLNFHGHYSDLPCDFTDTSEQTDVPSCRGPLLDHRMQALKSVKSTKKIKSIILDASPTHLEINPPQLDWGQRYLYFPSSAFLTVMNMHSDKTLNIYEPYSTNSQFYPCNSSEIFLAPGEVASLCFVFLPTWLGSSSAQLVVQTSFGGFLIQVKGFAVESPYAIKALVGDIASSGKWSRNLSLFNPFNEALYVEEVAAWISVSSGNISQSTKAVCSIYSNRDSDKFDLLPMKERLNVIRDEADFPVISLRPHRNWEVAPHGTEAIMELDFSYHVKAKLFGAFCMRFLRSSKKKVDTIVIPVEVELVGTAVYDQLRVPASVSLDILVPCDTDESVVVALAVRNAAPYPLSVVKVGEVGENAENFQVKYAEGLILFPRTVTHIAIVSYTPPAGDLRLQSPQISMECKLVILTNDSRNSQIEIPCSDIVSVCSRDKLDSSIGYKEWPQVQDGNISKKYLGSDSISSSQKKAVDISEIDEVVLMNWKSQATASGMSILDKDEVLFPMVQVGSHCSQWITVRNPSQQPVVMQLILNSGEIVDECRTPDRLLQHSSSSSLVGNKSIAPKKYGFSIAEHALTEAFVYPNGRASLGPIFFQPSSRCGWRSSALIRNNLSGVEWLYLQGFGGSLSLVLFEESEPIESLEFRLNLPTALNLSSSDMVTHMDDKSHACSEPLSKDLYAKNMGDLPLEVRKIKVSGTECGLDGFVVHACKGFSLAPGESIKLSVLYQADFSAGTIQRDLELVLATGILVIPMKASLPICMLNFCKRSVFWMRLKKSMIAIFFTACLLFLVLFWIFPHLVSWSSQDRLFRSGNGCIPTMSNVEKSSYVHHIHRNNNKFAMSKKMNGLLRSVQEQEPFLLESISRHPDAQRTNGENDSGGQHVAAGCVRQTNFFADNNKETALSSSSVSQSAAAVPGVSQVGSLRVKIQKNKGRRRRKKQTSTAGLTGHFEVSSSQSGNSTPSSPLSPVMSSTPKRKWPPSPGADQSIYSTNPFVQIESQHEKIVDSKPTSKGKILDHDVSLQPSGNNSCCRSNQEKAIAPRKLAGKPILLPSATFPSACRPVPYSTCRPPLLASTSTIAPHARAPGSKLRDQAVNNAQENRGPQENFTYDIWEDHLFGLRLASRSKMESVMAPFGTENNPHSFFVRDPQALMINSLQESVSLANEEG